MDAVEYNIERARSGDLEGAFHGLRKLDHSTLPAMQVAYRFEIDPIVRSLIVEAIWQHRQPSVIGFLADALQDPTGRGLEAGSRWFGYSGIPGGEARRSNRHKPERVTRYAVPGLMRRSSRFALPSLIRHEPQGFDGTIRYQWNAEEVMKKKLD